MWRALLAFTLLGSGQYQGVQVVVAGKAVATANVLNIGSGITAACSATTNSCQLSADTAVLEPVHNNSLVANSTCQVCQAGVKYAAAGKPTFLTPPTQGTQLWLTVDQPTQAGATLNLDGLGPIAFQGTCQRLCELITSQNTTTVFIVAFSTP